MSQLPLDVASHQELQNLYLFDRRHCLLRHFRSQILCFPRFQAKAVATKGAATAEEESPSKKYWHYQKTLRRSKVDRDEDSPAPASVTWSEVEEKYRAKSRRQKDSKWGLVLGKRKRRSLVMKVNGQKSCNQISFHNVEKGG